MGGHIGHSNSSRNKVQRCSKSDEIPIQILILTSGSGREGEREREIGEYEWPPRSQIAHSANIAGEEKEKEKEKEGEAAAAADAVVAAAVAGNGATPAATMMQGSGIRQIVFAFALKERTKVGL